MQEVGRRNASQGVSVIPYALFVPILVMLIQSAWIAQGWPFKLALIARAFHPLVLAGMAVVAAVSSAIIQRFRMHTASRWMAFVGCVIGFSILAVAVTPRLTH